MFVLYAYEAGHLLFPAAASWISLLPNKVFLLVLSKRQVIVRKVSFAVFVYIPRFVS